MARALPKPMPALAALVAGADVLTRPSGDVLSSASGQPSVVERCARGLDGRSDLRNETARRMFAQAPRGRSSLRRQGLDRIDPRHPPRRQQAGRQAHHHQHHHDAGEHLSVAGIDAVQHRPQRAGREDRENQAQTDAHRRDERCCAA